MSDLSSAVVAALAYADEQGTEVDFALRVAAVNATKFRGGNIGGVVAIYHDAITRALIAYFEGGAVGVSRNQFKNAMITAFGDAFDLGWQAAGGELPISSEALDWIELRMVEEAANIDRLYEEAKSLRRDKEFDFFVWLTDRADGYAKTVLSIYNAAAMFIKRKAMLTWVLGSAEKHCKTCLKLNGQSHQGKWFIAHNYIPRQPGASMDCGGYNCDCSLVDANGEPVTL